MIVILLLIILNILSMMTLQEPANLKKVKEMYTTFLNYVPEKFSMLKHRSIITGFHGKGKEIGYNTNKGYEIGICVDGTSNEMFHVLLHELAHSTVKEYDHSDVFWNNFAELREIASELGIYETIPRHTKFCGKYIRD